MTTEDERMREGFEKWWNESDGFVIRREWFSTTTTEAEQIWQAALSAQPAPQPLPPEREPMTPKEAYHLLVDWANEDGDPEELLRRVEAAHGIKGAQE